MIPTPVPVPYPYPPPEFPPVLPPLPTVVNLSVFQGMTASDGMAWLWVLVFTVLVLLWVFTALKVFVATIRLWRNKR